MNKVLVLVMLLCASQAMAANLSWSENFNSYPGNWGPAAEANGWILPTTNTSLDGYYPGLGGSGLAPRLGNDVNDARADFGATYSASASQNIVLSYYAGFSNQNSESEYNNGRDFIALGATLADIAGIPHDRNVTLGTPVDAIAIGHQSHQALYFFDGDSWTNIGNYTTSGTSPNGMRYKTGQVTVTIEPDGDVTISAPSSSGTDNATIAAGFSFQYLGISHVNAVSPLASAPASYDNISLTAAPEPATLVFLALGSLLMRRRRA